MEAELLARFPAGVRWSIDHNPARQLPYHVVIRQPNDARKTAVIVERGSLANALRDGLEEFRLWKLKR